MKEQSLVGNQMQVELSEMIENRERVVGLAFRKKV